MRSLILLLVSTQSLCQGFTPLSHAVSASSSTSQIFPTTALRAGASGDDQPFAVVVEATIEPDRMAEFLNMIQTNAEQSRKEPGCLRFDVLRSQDTPNRFFFYELYTGPSAIDYHKVR